MVEDDFVYDPCAYPTQPYAQATPLPPVAGALGEPMFEASHLLEH